MAGGGMGAAAPTSTGQQSGQPTGFSGVFGDGSTPGTIMQGTGLPPQGGMMGIGGGQLYTGGYGMPMASPAEKAPVGASLPAGFTMATTSASQQAPTLTQPTGLQFGTAGVGTGIVEAQAPTPQAAPQTMAPFQQQMMMRQQQQYNPYQQQMMRQNPYQQQQMAQQNPYQQQQFGGLQAALAQLMGRYNQPMQRQQFMPSYQNQALQYRPDLSQAQAALNRTATTKAQAQAAAEAAARAKLETEMGVSDEDAGFRAWQRQQYENSKYNYGG